MKEQLLKLAQVQTFDKTLYRLEQELVQIPERLAELDEEESKLAAAFEMAAAEFKELTAKKEALEKDNSQISAKMRKSEQRLMGAKTQREYRAANAEIEDGKDLLKANEDLLLEVMEKFEAAQTKTNGLQEKLDTFRQESAKERETLDQRAKAVEAEAEGLRSQRNGLVDGVEPQILNQYDFIRKRSRGVALAGVRDGSCQACHVDIPPQQYMELQRMDQILYCPACSRLLYWAEYEGFENF